ncbi:uncharacterized protein isoform X2 [Choristoneura fumiferana]|uniref:uncharacterized protein isoform X2 n=1 Tax=Choristoneura fumiferana TaxID=7141 RepID=UPI003D153694
MPCCVMRKCHNNTRRCKKADGIGYHNFPRNPILRQKWIAATGRKNWVPSKYSTICSIHFEDSCFIKKKKIRTMKKTAYPTIHILKFIDNEDENTDTTKDTPEISSLSPRKKKTKKLKGYIPPDDAVPSTSEEPVALVTLSTSGTRSPPQIQVERLTHTTTATTSSSANEMETLVIKTEEDDEDDEEMPLYTSDRHGTFSCMTQTSPIPEAGAPFDFKQPGPSDSSEILRLKHLLEEKSTVIYKQAKKIEMLDHEVNRLLARNQYLEDLLKESGISYED